MRGRIAHVSMLVLVVTLQIGCASKPELRPFTSDGCSLFPDRSWLGGDKDWCHCCTIHDRSYWLGGTRTQRLAADRAFRQCILDETGSKFLSSLMYTGVRLGGTPYLFTWFRWGYGWNAMRGYHPLGESALLDAEHRQVEKNTSSKSIECAAPDQGQTPASE